MMEIEIDAENLISNYFALRSEGVLTFSRMKKIKRTLEEKTDYQVYVDVTSDSLVEAYGQSPDLFTWNDTYVERGTKIKEEDFKKIDEKYNWRLPQDIKDAYYEVIKQFGSK